MTAAVGGKRRWAGGRWEGGRLREGKAGKAETSTSPGLLFIVGLIARNRVPYIPCAADKCVCVCNEFLWQPSAIS